ncbi:hypothetical protein ACFQ88_12780 [Paenibacillus sp. NPDC056579]|uniref:hypothetical protein n=1 Tax=unclassified Paenibacillus TaxID=185978 RepID=UPI001EF8F418|nr:hypothetical protein [Paenibacillus sp. H1-7]ULL17312.1 hypothetical protein DVH26_24430 [Paenibacillus sp. H1-7]
MSLRPVELQFVLHKNDEAGTVQNQLNHKPGQDQAALADAAAKHTEKERQSVSKSEKPHHSSILNEDKEQPGHKREQSSNKREQEQAKTRSEMERIEHPFKGKHIDLTL